MKHRDFVMLLGGAVALRPLSARAQKIPRIGVLVFTEAEYMGPFREALRDLGYVDGCNIQIELRSAQGQADRLSVWRPNWFAARLTSSWPR